MKLSNLIKTHNWLSVELILLQLYPDQESSIEAYRKVFENLKNLAPEESNMQIVLSEEEDFADEEDKETYVDVSGQDGTTDEYGNIISYAIEFTEWKKWLGMDLAPDTIKNFTELEIIAHCLYEITFMGYDENIIQEARKSLENTVEEFQNLTEEEKRKQTMSLEELKKRFGE